MYVCMYIYMIYIYHIYHIPYIYIIYRDMYRWCTYIVIIVYVYYIYMYNHIPIPSNTNWSCSGVSNQQKLVISLKNGRTRPISNVVGPCPQSCHRMDWHPHVLSTMASWELPQAGNSPKMNKIMRRSSIDWEFSSKPCLMTPECQTIETIVFTPKCRASRKGFWQTSEACPFILLGEERDSPFMDCENTMNWLAITENHEATGVSNTAQLTPQFILTSPAYVVQTSHGSLLV